MIAKVICCAICGTDVKLATIGHARCNPPRIIGHEMCGELTHVGDDIEGFEIGQKITLATTVACGECEYCKMGLGNICPNCTPISFDYNGAFAEYIEIPTKAIKNGNVIIVPDSVSSEMASLGEPLSCAINALEIINVGKGDKVLVIGGGPLGALNALAAKAMGAEKVMIVQRSQPRLGMLENLKDIIVLDGKDADLKQKVLDLTDGVGADAVVVTAPSKQAMEEAPDYARKGGAVSLFASLPKGESDITYDSRLIHYGELRIAGSSDSRPEHVQKAIDFIKEGKMDTSPVITHRVSLDDFDKGIGLMTAKESLKVLVVPNLEDK